MKPKYIGLALLTIAIWGVSLLGTRVMLDHNFSPNQITFLRFLIAWLIMTVVDKSAGRTSERFEKQDNLYLILMALGGISLFYFFENTGLKYTTVSNTSLITATIPLFTLLTARIFFKKKLHKLNWIGIILGLGGTFMLFYKDLLHSTVHIKGDIFVFGSVLMWIIYSFSYRKIMKKYSAENVTRRIFGLGTLFLLPVLAFDFKNLVQIQLGWQPMAALLYLAIICSWLAYLFWNISINKLGVKITSNIILLMPIFSIITGIIFLKEPFSMLLVFSTVLIISGAWFASVSHEDEEF
jgi:drug/metabolite transporter (DMT)-like permease